MGYGVPNYDGSDGNKSPVNSTGGISNLDRMYIKTLPILFLGSKNIYVKILQVLLNYYGTVSIDVDGEFGPYTKSAVATYQMVHSLQVDGMVGTETWTELLVLDKK